MVVQRYKVIHTDKISNITTDITAFVDMSEEEGIEASIDTFELAVTSSGGKFDGDFFDLDDLITIYFGNGTGTPTNLIMDGFLTEVRFELDENVKRWRLYGANRLERLTNIMLPAPYSSTSSANSPDEIIVDLIKRINKSRLPASPDKMIKFIYAGLKYADSDNTDVGTATSDPNTIVNTKTDGSAFPTLGSTNYPSTYSKIETPVFEMIEELSNTDWTQDTYPYIFYLDSNNYFYWKPRPTTDSSVSGENTLLIEGVNIQSAKLSKGSWGEFNAIILYCGTDTNDKGITTWAINLSQAAKNGIKWKHISKPEIADQIKFQNPTWDANEVRDEARKQGKNYANEILQSPKILSTWKGSVNMRGNVNFTKGNLYKLIIPTLTETDTSITNGKFTVIDPKKMRLKGINHSFDKNGWSTTLEFEEDPLVK